MGVGSARAATPAKVSAHRSCRVNTACHSGQQDRIADPMGGSGPEKSIPQPPLTPLPAKVARKQAARRNAPAGNRRVNRVERVQDSRPPRLRRVLTCATRPHPQPFVVGPLSRPKCRRPCVAIKPNLDAIPNLQLRPVIQISSSTNAAQTEFHSASLRRHSGSHGAKAPPPLAS